MLKIGNKQTSLSQNKTTSTSTCDDMKHTNDREVCSAKTLRL